MKTHELLIASLLVIAMGGTAHADRKIDAFSDPFPSQTPPGSSTGYELLWVGTWSGVPRSQDQASQPGLPGVTGGQRRATLTATTLSNLVTTTINAGELSYSSGTGKSGTLLLEYGATQDLNKNLATELAFELEVQGDMDDGASPRPVLLTVTVMTNGRTRTSSVQRSLVNDGVYQIPFSSFNGVDFADVDYLSFKFDASGVSAIDYALLGGLRTTNCLQTGSVIADIVLDDFITELPQSFLPGYGMVPFMWVGTFGQTQKYSDQKTQSNLLDTLRGQRKVLMAASDVTNFITTSIGGNELSYATGYPTSGQLVLQYGAGGDLNADLSQASAFELEINGDLDSSPARPVPLTITVRSNSVTRSQTITLINDGTYRVAFSQFPGVSFSDVDFIEFSFNATTVQAIDLTLLGGVRASACF